MVGGWARVAAETEARARATSIVHRSRRTAPGRRCKSPTSSLLRSCPPQTCPNMVEGTSRAARLAARARAAAGQATVAAAK